MKNPGGGIKRKYSSTLDDLVKVIGLPAMLFLSRAFGGRSIRIPNRPLPDAPLTRAIGEQSASQLCAQYRGEHLNIPAESTVLLQYTEKVLGRALDYTIPADCPRRSDFLEFRNALIRQEVANGGSILRVAQRYRLDRKMIRKIIGPRNGPTAAPPAA